MKIYVDNLSEGMVLAADLLTPKGRFILAAGATLQAQHLKILKAWGVCEADIIDESFVEKPQHKAQVDADSLEQAELFLRQRFSCQDLDHPFVVELLHLSYQRLAQQLAEGFVLPELKTLPTLDTRELPSTSAALVLRGQTDLVSLPDIYQRIVTALNSPQASSKTIGDIVSKDTNLAMRLLRLVNSAFYGFPGKIDSISRGITLLGTKELSTLALGITVMRLFRNIPSELINMESFWKHSIRCGLFAQALATHKVGISEEKLFVAGLLHDVGRLIMLQKIPQHLTHAILLAQQQQLPLYQLEKKLLQFDHAEIGQTLAIEWKLPALLPQMIGGHHDPTLERYHPEVCILHIADLLAQSSHADLVLAPVLPPLQRRAWETLALSPGILSAVFHQVDRLFRDIANIFLTKQDDNSENIGTA